MTHDGTKDAYDCDRDGFIMSASREAGGETKWSGCSAERIKSQRAGCLFDQPGLNRYLRAYHDLGFPAITKHKTSHYKSGSHDIVYNEKPSAV